MPKIRSQKHTPSTLQLFGWDYNIFFYDIVQKTDSLEIEGKKYTSSKWIGKILIEIKKTNSFVLLPFSTWNLLSAHLPPVGFEVHLRLCVNKGQLHKPIVLKEYERFFTDHRAHELLSSRKSREIFISYINLDNAKILRNLSLMKISIQRINSGYILSTS